MADGRDQIVAARVADPGQCIVFGENGDARAGGGAGELALERRLEPVHGSLHGQSLRRQRIAQQRARVVLVECEFRVRVDVVRYVDQGLRQRVDAIAGDLFQCGGHGVLPGGAMLSS